MYKYAMAPITSKKLKRYSLPTYMLLSAVAVLDVALASLEVPEGLMNYLVYIAEKY